MDIVKFDLYEKKNNLFDLLLLFGDDMYFKIKKDLKNILSMYDELN